MKLIISDLDGTLLNERGQISNENQTAIKKALSKGIKFAIASGRSYNSVSKLVQSIGLKCPIICTNGAEIYSENGQLIKRSPLKKQVSKTIIDLCKFEDLYFEIYSNTGNLVPSYQHYLQTFLDIFQSTRPDMDGKDILTFAEKRFEDEKTRIIESYHDIYNNPNLLINKILIFSSDLKSLENVTSRLSGIQDLNISSSGKTNLEFNDPSAQKGVALKILVQHLGIEMKDVMAVGDQLNDLTMLREAGYSVAMGNALPKIKDLCHFITKTNLEHGVAFAIKEILK